MIIENKAVIVLSKLTPDEKAKVVFEARAMCEKHDIELILPEHLKPKP